jgi:leader peptidase (prepilin peptidase)/N-methyltransferase
MIALVEEPVTERTPLRPTRDVAAAVVAGAAAILCVAVLGFSALDLTAAAVVAILVWVAAIDLEYRLLPNRIVVPTLVGLLVVTVVLDPSFALERLLASLATGAFFFVAAVIRPGSLGFGDVKLAALVGALLGADTMLGLVLTFVALAVVSLGLVVRDGRGALKTMLPLGPFFAVGALLALLASGG